MQRKRAQIKPKTVELSPGQEMALLWGFCLDGMQDFKSEADQKRAWKIYGKELTEKFYQDPKNREKKPWAATVYK